MSTIRVLAVIAAPSDEPSFDAAGAWNALEQALAPLAVQGRLRIERLDEPTEIALRRKLAEGHVDVLHFIGHGRAQQAKYATLSLLAADGRARNLTAQYLAKLLSAHRVRVAVLQVAGGPFGAASEILIEGALEALVTTGHFPSPAQALFARRFYGSVAGGGSFDGAIAEARSALTASGAAPNPLDIISHCSTSGARLLVEELPHATSAAPRENFPATEETGTPANVQTHARDEHARRELERKRLAGAFDVFLCHNWADKPAVKQIAQQLKTHGILPWLDEWELPPGQPWQPLLEQQIASIKSAAVFVGAGGVGPWQEQELYGFLREFVSRRAPVIPVLLMNAPDKPKLPVFLSAMTWVEFRKIDPDPLAQFIWGITGQRIADDSFVR